MENSTESVSLNEAIDLFAKQNGFMDYESVISPGSQTTNYLSSVKRIHLVGRKKDGSKAEECIFVKMAFGSVARNTRQGITDKFHREAFIYNSVVSQFEEIQRCLKPSERFPFVKCFLATDATLIFEDLTRLDFKDILDHKKTLDLDHVVLLMKGLARFHALSFAFKAQKPRLFEDVTKDMVNIFCASHRTNIITDNAWQRALGVIADEGLKEVMLRSGKEMKEKSKLPAPLSPNAVICHGDSNLRNALFKYDNNGKPVFLMLIDYQLAYLGSPATDILFMIFSSTSKELRAHHYEHLLDIYYSTLKTFLELLDCNVDSHYSKETLMSDLHEYFPKAFVAILILLRVVCRPHITDEELNTLYGDTTGKASIFDYNNCEDAEKLYSSRINDVLEDFVRLQFIV